MDQNTLKSMIVDLEYREAELNAQLKKTKDAISALQEICEHDFEYQGHDSHSDWVKCKYCGKEQKG